MGRPCPNCGFVEKRVAYLVGFDQFWNHYPRRVGKGAARKVWSKLKPDVVLLGRIMDAIEEQKQTDSWKKEGGIYIPHPATWLNQERWFDEVGRPRKEEPEHSPEKVAESLKKLERLREMEYQRLHGNKP